MLETLKASIARARDSATAVVLLLGGWGLLFYGVVIFGYQVYFWLKYGEWVAVKVIYFFTPAARVFGDASTPVDLVPEWFHGSWRWLLGPDSWFGLHKVVYGLLDVLPVSLLF